MGSGPSVARTGGVGVNDPPEHVGGFGEVLPVNNVSNPADGHGDQQRRRYDVGHVPNARKRSFVRLSQEGECLEQ